MTITISSPSQAEAMEASSTDSATKSPIPSGSKGTIVLDQPVPRDNSPDSRNAVNGENM